MENNCYNKRVFQEKGSYMKELVNLKKILVAGAFVMGAASVMSTAMVNSVHAEGDILNATLFDNRMTRHSQIN